jgi:alpha-tubulin suppressor-like RCC1 family protein
MSDRYPGGLIRKTPPTITPPVDGEGGSAPGIWTLEQVAYYIKEGTWPKPTIPRELYAWGSGGNGSTGLNTTANTSSPTQVGGTDWSSIGRGSQGEQNAAIKLDGTLWIWGDNTHGQLGDNTTVIKSSPVQVGALTTWSKVATGQYSTAAIKTDGTLWTWGYGFAGQLGLNDINISRSSPVQVGALTNWSNIGGDGSIFGAIKTDGTIWSWGDNSGFGALGQNNVDLYSSPTQIGSGTDWASINVNIKGMNAIKTSGALWNWGRNDQGQLGQDDRINRSSPTQVGALTNWSKATDGGIQVAAIKTDGTLWAVGGRNTLGALGLNDAINRSSPVQISADTDWSTVSGGTNDMVALKTDGTLWVWGYNANGEAGQDNTITYSSPVQIGSGTTWQVAVASKQSAFGITKG